MESKVSKATKILGVKNITRTINISRDKDNMRAVKYLKELANINMIILQKIIKEI